MSATPTDDFAAFLDAANQPLSSKENPFEPSPEVVQNAEPSMSTVQAEAKDDSPVLETPSKEPLAVQPTAQPNGQFDLLGEQPVQPQAATEQQPGIIKENFKFPAAETKETEPEVPTKAEPTSSDAATQSETTTSNGQDASASTSIDPFVALQKQQEQRELEQLLEPLRKKNPVFKYGDKDDELTDPDETFLLLKQRMEGEFSEFQEGAVAWKVEYGKETKTVSKNTDKIHEVKKQIEESKAFQERLRKAKTDAERSPVCYVKPIVTGKKKGELQLPNFKAHCETQEDALLCPKPIVILPSKDGRFYRLEKNPIGTFIAPAQTLPEFQAVDTAFQLSMKKIPLELLFQCIAFFRSIWMKQGTEALAMIRYNKVTGEYRIDVPEQNASLEGVEAVDGTYELDEDSIHVMDIHSHHTMDALFSTTDNRDERKTGLYAVVGRFDDPVPDITLRASCGGYFFPVELSAVFATESSHPATWMDKVHKQKDAPKLFHLGSFKTKVQEAAS